MFKEIETEIMSMISVDPIDKIAHMVTKNIAKTMELIYNIEYEKIEKAYTEEINKDLYRVTIIYHGNPDDTIGKDICMINGKPYIVILIPYDLFNVDNTDANTLCKSIIYYIITRIDILINKFDQLSGNHNKMNLILIQSIPVITCAVMRQIFNGPSLAKLIYTSLCEIIDSYKTNSSEQGINSILNLFDEGLGVSELLDNGYICAIPMNDKNYPGLWGSIKEE